MPDPKRQLFLWLVCGWVVSLNGEFQNNLDDDDFSMNFTTLWDILKPQGPNPFLHELNGHWSFNDTIDISKYEDFDHTRFEKQLNPFISHQVVGRVAYDVVADLSDSLSLVRKLVGWARSVNGGTSVIPIPQDIIVRYQQPRVWNNNCSGAWPCTTIVPYSSSSGAQSQYINKYGYIRRYSRGNTQIVNSNYDSGNSYGYGDTGSAANQYSSRSGSYPASTEGGIRGYTGSGCVYPSYSTFIGARSIGDGKESRGTSKKRAYDSWKTDGITVD